VRIPLRLSPTRGRNDINASSDFGLDGGVFISLPDINALQGTTELPSNFVEFQQTTAQACSVNRESIASNSFVINGKGGIMPTPDAPLNSQDIIINGELTRNNHPPVQPIVTSQGNI
jgi:large exoprotein involved in heme utilization and adhesion